MRLTQQPESIREIVTNHEAHVARIMKQNGVVGRLRVKGNVHTGRNADGIVVCHVRA